MLLYRLRLCRMCFMLYSTERTQNRKHQERSHAPSISLRRSLQNQVASYAYVTIKDRTA